MTEHWRDTYDAWKLATPPEYEMTGDEERTLEEAEHEREQEFRAAIADVLSQERGTLYLATVRQIVIEELNKLRPIAGEPAWQAATPVPVPALG